MIDRTDIVLLLALLLLFTGCSFDHKKLEYGGAADVSVYFDWSAVPDANPASMALLVYGNDTRPVGFPFAGKTGGNITVFSGATQFIAYNDDTEDLYTTGDTWGDFQICSQQTSLVAFTPMFNTKRAQPVPRAPFTEDQIVIREPDQLWTAAQDYTMLVSVDANSIVLPMREATKTYTFTFKNVGNLEHVTEVAATLSGMSEGWIPSKGHGSDTECIIPFNLQGNDASTLTGSVRTFGHCPGHNSDEGGTDAGGYEHKLVLYVQMSDGQKYYYTFDITDELHAADPPDKEPSADSGGEVDIVIEDIPLPKPLQNGSGIHPDVSDWTEVNIKVYM